MTRLPSLLPYCNQVIGAKALSIAPPIGKALGLMPREEVIMARQYPNEYKLRGLENEFSRVKLSMEEGYAEYLEDKDKEDTQEEED